MESFRIEWNSWSPMKTEMTPAKGVFHLKKIATKLSEYWKEQSRSPNLVQLPDPQEIIKAVSREQIWEPVLSPHFLQRCKINEFCRIYNPPPIAYAPYVLYGNVAPAPPATDPQPAATAPPAATSSGVRVNNTNYNNALFQEFKQRNVRAQDICR